MRASGSTREPCGPPVCTGVAFVDSLARATGADTDRSGRIKVNSDLTVSGHPEISVIGDVACLEAPAESPFPGSPR